MRATTKVFAIAWKDLRSTMRNVPALAMMLLAPLALAGLLGFAFGGGDSFDIAATKVALASEDVRPAADAPGEDPPPLAGDTLVEILTGEGLKDVLEVAQVDDAAAARARVDDGDAAVAVVVPRDFTAALYGNEGVTTGVELYVDPTQEFGTAITESVATQALLDFNGARAAATVAAAMAGGEAGHDDAAQAAAAAFVQDGGVSQSLVLTDRAPSAGGDEGEDTTAVGLILAGMMVFFMFFGASNVARTILTEDQDGTLPRMMTTPTPAGVILGGKFASVFLTVIVQLAVLLAGGAIFFGIGWGRPDVVAVLSVSTAAVASGLALMIMGVVKTPGQAGAIGAGIYLVLALLGGNFTGTATTAGTYATVQGFTPNGPLLRGWDAAMRGGGLADVAGDLVVPLAFAAGFFAVAVWRFRRRYA
jgi:ABC-2 type transport system permease protein